MPTVERLKTLFILSFWATKMYLPVFLVRIDERFQTYLDRFTSEDAVIFPAPQSIDDLENFPELHQQNLERLRKQA